MIVVMGERGILLVIGGMRFQGFVEKGCRAGYG